MILTIKTDQPEAKLALLERGTDKPLDKLCWEAHRQLAATILTKITTLLEQNSITFTDLTGLIVFEGPGSFTGLRIGATVANTLAYSLDVPVVGTNGDRWQHDGVNRLASDEDDRIIQPVYGGEANITRPRK